MGRRRTHAGLERACGWLVRPRLGQEESALLTLSLISVWRYVGIPMMLIYAALLTVPEEIVEAAHVEGAGLAHLLEHQSCR